MEKEWYCDYFGKPVSKVRADCAKGEACQFCMAFQTPAEKALVDAYERDEIGGVKLMGIL